MPFAIDIPHFYALVRTEYLYDLESHHGEFCPCLVFGVDSVEGHAIGFDILTDFGGQFARLPISALAHLRTAAPAPLHELELWNNFSYDVEAHEYAALRQLRVDVRLRGKGSTLEPGEYMFTLSWKNSPYAEQPSEGGFKRAHIIKLDNGNYAAQPNNRIRWYEPSFITKPFPSRPDFKTNSHIWNAERGGSSVSTEDTNRYFYKVDDEQVKDTKDEADITEWLKVLIVGPNTGVWIGYGCGGYYYRASFKEAVEVLRAEKPKRAVFRSTRKQYHGLQYDVITAEWLENCVCVIVAPYTWDFTSGEPDDSPSDSPKDNS